MMSAIVNLISEIGFKDQNFQTRCVTQMKNLLELKKKKKHTVRIELETRNGGRNEIESEK